MRRSFYIIFAIVLVIAVAIIIWLFFFSKSGSGSIVSGPNNPFPESAPGSIFRLPNVFGGNDNKNQTSFEITKGEEQVLIKLWDKPVGGYAFVERQVLEQVASTTVSGSTTVPAIEQVRATSSSILFVDRTTGYIHQYDKRTGQISQATNTLVPGVYDAYFASNGSYVLYRSYNEDRGVVVSSLYRVPQTTPSSGPVGLEKLFDLPDSVVSVAVNKNGNQIAFIARTSSGGALYTMTEDKGNSASPFPAQKTTITNLPLYEWNLSYGGDVLYMTPKASAYVPGYTIEVFSGRRVVSNKTGLASLGSPDQKLVFSTMFAQSGLVSFFTNRVTGSLAMVSMKTVASKCSFSPFSVYVWCGVPSKIPLKKQGYPDDWYQGTASFSDSLFRAYPDGGTSLVLDLKQQSGEDIDLVNPFIDSRESSLVFTNKKNGDLWLVNLSLLGGD